MEDRNRKNKKQQQEQLVVVQEKRHCWYCNMKTPTTSFYKEDKKQRILKYFVCCDCGRVTYIKDVPNTKLLPEKCKSKPVVRLKNPTKVFEALCLRVK